MAISGSDSSIKINGGTSTAMADEGMTDSGDGVTFYTTDSAKNVWDPDTTVVIKDNGSAVDATTYTVDYKMGEVVFDSAPTGPVTVTGNYYTLYSLANARGFSASLSRTLPEDTVFSDTHVSRKAGLADAAGTAEHLEIGKTEYTTSEDMGDDMENGRYKLLECRPSALGSTCLRVWVRFEGFDFSMSPADIQTLSQSWMGVVPGGEQSGSWSIGDPEA